MKWREPGFIKRQKSGGRSISSVFRIMTREIDFLDKARNITRPFYSSTPPKKNMQNRDGVI